MNPDRHDAIGSAQTEDIERLEAERELLVEKELLELRKHIERSLDKFPRSGE